ncbi:MjaI family restriction endonuclease [Salinimicrobium sp. TIG7-5_MAKvit]|uniref:hypothetical protein n=1 Tax=Salinimicrobium sp. TIG7-5_MAKvit TaxID=3121289 RepID=UPI003C6E70E5
MDAFVNDIDHRAFAKTNAPWNQLMLNDPWSVGYVTTLITLKPFANKEEWESFYYEMGEYRQRQLKALSPHQSSVLKDFQLKLKDPEKVRTLPFNLININTQNGRTQGELEEKGIKLYEYMKSEHPEISLKDCVKAVRFRVICETWNGVILREKRTAESLRSNFPQFQFNETSGENDHKYAVDFEVYRNGKLLCGIQIKPRSYLANTPYLIRAKAANKRKFEEYFQAFGVSVFIIISDMKGIINTYESDYKNFISCLKKS